MDYVRQKSNDTMITVLLCQKLSEEGIRYEVEYTAKRSEQLKKFRSLSISKNCRFDVVIVSNSGTKIAGIIETKARKTKADKQLAAYKAFGVPVFLCCGTKEIQSAVDFAEQVSQASDQELDDYASTVKITVDNAFPTGSKLTRHIAKKKVLAKVNKFTVAKPTYLEVGAYHTPQSSLAKDITINKALLPVQAIPFTQPQHTPTRPMTNEEMNELMLGNEDP
jgi:hypothetical protein